MLFVYSVTGSSKTTDFNFVPDVFPIKPVHLLRYTPIPQSRLPLLSHSLPFSTHPYPHTPLPSPSQSPSPSALFLTSLVFSLRLPLDAVRP